MGRTGNLTVRDSLGENRPLEWTMELDERTFEFADNTFAITLRQVEDENGSGQGDAKTNQISIGLLLQLHKNYNLIVLDIARGG